MRNAELRSSGQRVINQKFSSQIYLYAELPPEWTFNNFPTLKNKTSHISTFVQQTNLSEQHALLQIRSAATINSALLITHS